MALLKAFVCQVLLLGLYKVFLEKVVEEHLVPDELTRNCLVGFVCLLCFGIQLYTDKAGDDDESEEDLKIKSKSRGSTGALKFELTEMPLTEDSVTKLIGSKESCHSLNTETTSQKIATGKSQFSVDPQEVNSKEVSRAETKVSGLFPNVGTVSEFSTNISSTTNEAASTYDDSFEQNTRSLPVLIGTSEEHVCEESDEETIEIDPFVPKESAEKAEKSISHKVEATKLEQVTLGSECLSSNGMPTSQDSGSSINGTESESNIINGKVEESSNVKNEMSLNSIKEMESKKSTEENKVGDKVETSSKNALESKEHAKENIPCFQERYCARSTSTKVELNTPNKSNAETSTVLPPRRRKLSQNVTSVNIDISFLYAFY